MGCRIALLILIILIGNFNVFSQDPEWLVKMKQLSLLTDSYDDAVKVFGDSNGESREKKYSAYFDLHAGRIFVGFASGLCTVTPYSDGIPIGWKVPEWSIISMSFTPKRPLNPKKLPFDLATFGKTPVNDSPGAFILENNELGIELAMNSKKRITFVGLRPPQKFDALHCKK